MSRTGKNPIDVPKDVKVNVASGLVSIEGPKGKLDLSVPDRIKVEFNEGKLTVTRLSDDKQSRCNHGTVHAHLNNMIIGVREGHKKDLEIQGIGFRAQLQGKKIALNLGFSHPVEFDVPDSVTAKVPTQTSISIEGADVCMVGQVAAKIRALKPVEPYKGKGIRYVGEHVRRKLGKSATK